jgi:preprotein translocase subunit SecB
VDEPRVLLTRDSYRTELANASGETIAKIEATFIAAFNLDSDFEPTGAEVEEFSKSTGRLVLRPYVREFIHHACMQMGIPSYILEVLQFRGVVTSDQVENAPVGVSTLGA